MTRVTWVLVTAMIVTSAAAARADEPAEPEQPARRTLLLHAHETMIEGSTLNVNLTRDLVAKPVSLAPSIYYGISSTVTIGLTHDGGTTPFTPSPGIRIATHSSMGTTLIETVGGGVCVSGNDHGCPNTYDNIGLDTIGQITTGSVEIASHAGLELLSFDPKVVQLRIGALGRVQASRQLAVTFDPRVGLGLNQRDAGNKETLDVPVWLWFLANPYIGTYVTTGVAGQLAEFSDSYMIKLGVGASFTLCRVTLGIDLVAPNALGRHHSLDGRLLGLRAAYSFW